MLKELAAGVAKSLSTADRVQQMGEVCKDQEKLKVTSRKAGKRTQGTTGLGKVMDQLLEKTISRPRRARR